MMKEIDMTKYSNIAVLAPHPDDEALGAANVLLRYSKITDVYIVTDGCFGAKDVAPEKEAVIRRQQLEEEMKIVNPRNYFWMGLHDKSLPESTGYFEEMDFSKYDAFFISWDESTHPDHRAMAKEFLSYAESHKIKADVFMYEVRTPFEKPTHYADITDIIDDKVKLIRCHADQLLKINQDELAKAMNKDRACEENKPDRFFECYLKVNSKE